MLVIAINGEQRQSGARPENWAELLSFLEQHDGLDRSVVTAVRFDGVDIPTFRDPATLARPVDDLASIEVDTTPVSELLHESARVAHTAVAPLQRAVGRIATCLRAHDAQAVNRDMPELMAALRTLTTLMALLSEGTTGACRSAFDALAARLCRVFEVIIERHMHSDWDGVADLLERDLAPALDRWAAILAAVQDETGRIDPSQVAGPACEAEAVLR